MTPDIPITDVTLREDNPYAVGTIIDFGDGELLLEREPIDVPRSINDRYYTTIENEKLHDVAFSAWGNSKWYWALMDVNEIDFPFDIPIGTSLLVPDLEMIKLHNYDR
jgi:hypothetical protein